MTIIDLADATPDHREQAARILVDAFAETAPAYCNTLEEAREEVDDSNGPDRIARLALDDNGEVMGWIGGQPHYDGRVWELHPMAVAPLRQGRGIGSALVRDFERCVRESGGLTIWLGTDDETNQTNLGGIDLYPDVLEKVRGLRSLWRHASEFYRNMGFEVVGVMPDANGFGKPDIYLAKRVESAGTPLVEDEEGAVAQPDGEAEAWTDQRAMSRCRELAERARAQGYTAVGALVVLDGEVVAEATEEAPGGADPFAHAEILVARAAVKRFGRGGLKGATLYSTAEPCFLCSYGVREAGFGRVVLGSPVPDVGGATSAYPLLVVADVPRWGPPPRVEWWSPDSASPVAPTDPGDS